MIGVVLLIAAAVFILAFPIICFIRIHHRKCPVCGSPIEEYGDANFSGFRCTKCNWYITN